MSPTRRREVGPALQAIFDQGTRVGEVAHVFVTDFEDDLVPKAGHESAPISAARTHRRERSRRLAVVPGHRCFELGLGSVREANDHVAA